MPGSVDERFMVDNVALVQGFLRVLRFVPVSIIPPCLSIHNRHLGNEQKVRWRPQFRDTVSPQRHEQQQQHLNG
jgi:hypothetical protein